MSNWELKVVIFEGGSNTLINYNCGIEYKYN